MRRGDPIPAWVVAAMLGVPLVPEVQSPLTGMRLRAMWDPWVSVGFLYSLPDFDGATTLLLHPETPGLVMSRNLATAYRPEGVP